MFHENGNKFNVIDGQQRLTTITLLLSYLEKSEIVKNKIFYAVRERSNDFIQKVISNEDQLLADVIRCNDFDEFLSITSEIDKDYDFQDIYFMFTALRTMDSWFKKKEKEIIKPLSKLSFREKLLRNVKLIVNSISGIAEQELFMNLHSRRVQLDGSDLVRAILITRVAKKEMEDFDSKEVKDVVRLNERRIRIGWELDELNTWWSRENAKEFFSFFTTLKTGEKETIKFEERKHPINLLYKIWAESNRETEIKLGSFETKNTNALSLYVSIILLHRTLKDWYEDREIYHYLGFLFSQRSISFSTIWKKWDEKNITRNRFISFLKTELQKCVFGPEPNGEKVDTGFQFWLEKIKDYNSKGATHWKGTPTLQKIFLLLDIIEHADKRENGNPLPHLKPLYFKNQKEDEEHIFPSTPKDIKEIASLPNPDECFNAYIEKLNEDYKGDKLINWIFSSIEWDDFSDEEKNLKLQSLKDEIHLKRPINSIGNLVLLHQKINRGFGNNYYPQKRVKVVENTEDGKYVRHHTLKVFVKQTDSNDLNNWTMKDIANNADKIHDTLKDFFYLKNEEVTNE